MLMESFVAIMALIAAATLEPGLYHAMNAPAGLLGTTAESASHAVAGLGFTITPDQLTQAAKAVEEHTLIARTGGAPTLAVGMSEIFSGVFGGTAMKAFWYHFAIMFEALFILTTVDAGTRVGRFMLPDMLGGVFKPLGRVNWKPGIWLCSGLVVAAWGYFLYTGATDPLGGINQLFPLFGIANQLLAAIALAVCTTVLVKSGRLRWAWSPASPWPGSPRSPSPPAGRRSSPGTRRSASSPNGPTTPTPWTPAGSSPPPGRPPTCTPWSPTPPSTASSSPSSCSWSPW
jgi:carbon starvation protein